jgi:CheY-like chemotaxis protein
LALTKPLRKPTVLAVDDKPANLLALEMLLAEEYQLLRANSGEEAVSMVATQPHIDVILLDVQMPGMDGFETAEAIKRTDAGKDIPIIFVTAVYNEDPYVKKGYQAGEAQASNLCVVSHTRKSPQGARAPHTGIRRIAQGWSQAILCP